MALLTPTSIQQELMQNVATRLFSLPTFGVMKGVLIQVTPQNEVDVYEELVGSAIRPFWSVSSVLPESFREGDSYNNRDAMDRAITVVLYENKLTAMKNAHVYQAIRQIAMRSLSKVRFAGEFTSDPSSCILSGRIRPKSYVEAAAWLRNTGYVSAFDVVLRTLEPFGPRYG